MLTPRGGRVSFALTGDEFEVLAASSFLGLTGTDSARAGDNCREIVRTVLQRFGEDPDVQELRRRLRRARVRPRLEVVK